MIINPQHYLEFDQWCALVNALCDFAYMAGQEAAHEGLDRGVVLTLELIEPQTILAWELGYDDESREFN